jgi:hypothetical protein
MNSFSHGLCRIRICACVAPIAFVATGCVSHTSSSSAESTGTDGGTSPQDGGLHDAATAQNPVDGSTSAKNRIDGSTSASEAGGSPFEGGAVVMGTVDASLATDAGGWTNVTSNLAGLTSECGNMTYLTAKPDEDFIIAGIALQGLWGSRNGGQSWSQLGQGSGSAVIDHRPSDIVFDPSHTNVWWESGIYGTTEGVYVTSDDGTTFEALGTIHSNDAVSVDFTDPNRQTLLAGAHETPQELYKSTDGGAGWTNVGAGLPSTEECPEPYVIDSQTYLVGCNKSVPAIFRSTDGATTWTQVASEGGMYAPLVASDGTIYWGSSDGAFVRSSDMGQTGTQPVKPYTFMAVAPIELPNSKRIATLAGNQVVVSADQGVTWNAVTPALQTVGGGGNGWIGLAYDKARSLLLAWYWTCGSAPVPVPSDAIMAFPFEDPAANDQ